MQTGWKRTTEHYVQIERRFDRCSLEGKERVAYEQKRKIREALEGAVWRRMLPPLWPTNSVVTC
jgi:gamma-glutamylcysteine synthetase